MNTEASRDIKECSKKDLEILYCKIGLSLNDMGEIFNLSAKGISYHLGKHDIETRKNGYVGEGKDNPNWKGGDKKYKCQECGKISKTNPKQAEKRKYCSEKCEGEARSSKIKGENNPAWKDEKAIIECRWCGKKNEFKPSFENKKFCDEECYSKWQSEYKKGKNTGSDNPMWKEDPSRDYRYGRNWTVQRRRAIERDNHECQLCKSVKNLEVHHKKPISTFDRSESEWWKEANDLENLITLCVSCHKKLHANEGQAELDLFQ